MSESSRAWNEYWKENQSANSFEFDYSTKDGPYGEVNTYWQQIFANFYPDTNIVDLASGNGALSNLYLQCYPTAPFSHWTNVDLAQTKKAVKHEKVEYVQDDLGELSLANNSVDHFVSMYGLEYADFDKSLAHIKRCLRENGDCHFVLHHHDSIISKQSALSISAYARLFSAGLFTKLEKYKEANDLKKHLLNALNTTLHGGPKNEQDDVKLVGQQVFHILQQSQSMAACLQYLHTLHKQLELHVIRLKQQLAAADNASLLPDYLTKHDLTHRIDTMTFQNHILAWTCIVNTK